MTVESRDDPGEAFARYWWCSALPFPLPHRPSKLSHIFTYSPSLILELVILTVMVGKLRVGADMGSVGSELHVKVREASKASMW